MYVPILVTFGRIGTWPKEFGVSGRSGLGEGRDEGRNEGQNDSQQEKPLILKTLNIGISMGLGNTKSHQGCQMVFFQTKNPNLGKFWRVLQLKLLVYFMAIWYSLRPFAIFYGNWVYFLVIWYILSCFGMLYLATLSPTLSPHS
jgi:hypothetical protein